MTLFAIIGFFPFDLESLGEGKSLLFSSVELQVNVASSSSQLSANGVFVVIGYSPLGLVPRKNVQ
jgi:hypothetical protein